MVDRWAILSVDMAALCTCDEKKVQGARRSSRRLFVA
jgi:hypothetical protein